MNFFPMHSRSFGVFSVALALIYLLPISIFGSAHGKLPIDIVPSDFIVIFSLTFYLLLGGGLNTRAPIFNITYLFLYYMLILTLFTVIANSDVQPFYSFVKFAKTFLAMWTGYIVGKRYGLVEPMKALSNAAFIYIIIYGASEFLYYQNFQPRLGSKFLGFDVYGFPNSSASYIVFILYLSLAFKRHVAFTSLAIILASALSIGSLSRAALLVLTLSSLYFCFSSLKRISRVIFIILLMGLSSIWIDWVALSGMEPVLEGIMIRLHSAQSSGDISNGRFDIFLDTIYLVRERPLTGYGFITYSNFSNYGTPHNQYLEVLFKTGVIGFLFFLTVLLLGIKAVVSGAAKLPPQFNGSALVSLITVIYIGNFVQPNITYSPTGNLLFLVLGLLSSGSYLRSHPQSKYLAERN